jgi:hypothetical protein
MPRDTGRPSDLLQLRRKFAAHEPQEDGLKNIFRVLLAASDTESRPVNQLIVFSEKLVEFRIR